MARGKSKSRKEAAGNPVAESTSEPTELMSGDTANTTPAINEPDTQSDLVKMKEAITAPFMIYDAAARRIVPNPAYNRNLLTEVRKLQSIVLTKLRTPMQAHLSYTPKELLYELESTLFYLCASAAVKSNDETLNYFLSDAEADAVMPQLESFLAHHDAPAKSTVALAYCLTEGTSHDMLTSFITLVQQRVEAELSPSIDRKRSEAEHKALRSTKNNLHDMAQLLRDVATAYHCVDTASQVQRRQPQSDPTQVDAARSPAANAVPAQMVEESFYKVLRWVLAVDADRRALRAAAMTAAGHGGGDVASSASPLAAAVVAAHVATSAAQEAAATGFAKVVDYDPFTGHATLERVGEGQRWGLLLNSKGLLVGLENDLRNSSAAGERLYDAVQQQSGDAGGLAIYEVNRRRIRPVHLSEEALATSQSDILQKLRHGLTQPTKTLHLSIEKRKQADLTSPHEVLYEVSYQGGENGVGQRCLLMLERASPSISWGLKLKYLKGQPALLSDFSPNVRLSAAAKNFLFDVRGRVRVLKLNNKELAKLSAPEMKELVSGALILTMQLQVTDEHGEVPEGDGDAVESVTKADGAVDTPQTEVTAKSGKAAAVEGTAKSVNDGEGEDADEEQAALDDREAEDNDAQQVIETTAKAAEAIADAATKKTKTLPSSIAQAELDDVAAAIADEFLLKHSQLTEDDAHVKDGEATHDSDEADTDAVDAEAGDSAKTQRGVAKESGDAFEELEWAKPTTTFGAPGQIEDEASAEDDAPLDDDAQKNKKDNSSLRDAEEDEAALDAGLDGDEHAVERALLKEFNLLPENGDAAVPSIDSDASEERQELDDHPAADGDDNDAGAVNTADKEDAAELEEAEQTAIEAAEEAEGEAEALVEENAGTEKTKGRGRKGKGKGKGKGKKGGKKAVKAKKTRGRKKKIADTDLEGEEEEENEEKEDAEAEERDAETALEENRDEEKPAAVDDGEAEAEAVEDGAKDGAAAAEVDEAEEQPAKKKRGRKALEESKEATKKRGRAALKSSKKKREGKKVSDDAEDADDDAEAKDADVTTTSEEIEEGDAVNNATQAELQAETTAGVGEATAAVAAGAVPADTPLVDLPPTAAEAAMEAGAQNAAKKKRGRPSKTKAAETTAEVESEKPQMQEKEAEEKPAEDATAEKAEKASSVKKTRGKADAAAAAALGADSDATASSTRVSLNELVHAAPMTFENDVRLKKFDGSTLELERGSVSSPWNIKVAFAGDDIIMTKLPPIPPAQLQHPFLRSLGAGAQGEVKWVVEGLNGQDLSMMNKSLKTKALDAIKGSTKLSFVLKALRK